MSVSRATLLLASITAGITLLSGGCMRIVVTPPPPELFTQAPPVVSATQMYADYLNDVAAADTAYTGKEMWLEKVAINSSQTTAGQPQFCLSCPEKPAALFNSSGVVLPDRLPTYMVVTLNSPTPYLKGDIFEAVCTCRGMIGGNLVIDVIWMNKIGSGGTAVTTTARGY